MKTNLTACTESSRTGFRAGAGASVGLWQISGQAWAHLGLLVTAALDAQQDILHLAVVQLAYGGPAAPP